MDKRFDVFGMCNALYDIQAEVGDEFVSTIGFNKGGMFLIEEEQQRQIIPNIYSKIVNSEAGGSGANTMIGVAVLGGTACYTSHVGKDEHGVRYRKSLEAKGVKTNLGAGEGNTGVSLILITPDAQRTMCTYLGNCRNLCAADVNVKDLRASKYLYVTGYLWDTESQKEALLLAMEEAKKADVKIAFSLSDPFCVTRHRAEFQELISKYVDVVFGNATEVEALTGTDDIYAAAAELAQECELAAVTRDMNGSIIQSGAERVEIPVYKVQAVDTTGAGDMYAAGMLYGLTHDMPLEFSGRLASYLAGQVVANLGPRLDRVDASGLALFQSAGHD